MFAVCTDISWVPCPTCKSTQYPHSLVHESDSGLIFVRKNNCNAPSFIHGMLNLAVVVLMVVALWTMNKLQKRMTVKFDLDEQTAQDYSIQITNPPPDANDPKEWIVSFILIYFFVIMLYEHFLAAPIQKLNSQLFFFKAILSRSVSWCPCNLLHNMCQ